MKCTKCEHYRPCDVLKRYDIDLRQGYADTVVLGVCANPNMGEGVIVKYILAGEKVPCMAENKEEKCTNTKQKS